MTGPFTSVSLLHSKLVSLRLEIANKTRLSKGQKPSRILIALVSASGPPITTLSTP